ncbi:DMT family transporter [Leucobacter chromiiresistens]|uniref:Small multidrug resistance pump n=1 Tax=Leucobacter chromiiresistens TaxID=1079994 RepID=A0A1H0Y5I1_9MICO|nr:SMR family transporter [Leucobacter chromiiresistens]SDQ10372.1 small multidrug resistance pump [Leucobacter chromiiresistens]
MMFVTLAIAIVTEVSASLSLRVATTATPGKRPSRLWFVAVAVGYLTAFVMLSVTLSLGMALGVAYGIWAAIGVALTAVMSRVLFKEPLTWVMGAGIALIGAGVLLVELGAQH